MRRAWTLGRRHLEVRWIPAEVVRCSTCGAERTVQAYECNGLTAFRAYDLPVGWMVAAPAHGTGAEDLVHFCSRGCLSGDKPGAH